MIDWFITELSLMWKILEKWFGVKEYTFTRKECVRLKMHLKHGTNYMRLHPESRHREHYCKLCGWS